MTIMVDWAFKTKFLPVWNLLFTSFLVLDNAHFMFIINSMLILMQSVKHGVFSSGLLHND